MPRSDIPVYLLALFAGILASKSPFTQYLVSWMTLAQLLGLTLTLRFLLPSAVVFCVLAGVFIGTFGVGLPNVPSAFFWALLWTVCLLGILTLIFVAVGVILQRLWLVCLLTVFKVRQLHLARKRLAHPVDVTGPDPPGTQARPLYFIIVLGSGGHTKEMICMLEQRHEGFENIHRRYIISSGDTMSVKHIDAFEEKLKETFPGALAGSFEKYTVTRARRVHQALLTTPLTALYSILDILPLLLRRPNIPGVTTSNYPNVVLTNGPATGFFVALVAHILKLFYIVHEEKLQVFYVESWARVQTLSLTGKLLYYAGIADLFVVQHQPVADKYGLVNAGFLVLGIPPPPPPNPKPKS